MSKSEDEFNALAHALVSSEFDFDAVERGSMRAEWSAGNREVTVTDRATGEAVRYSADDLVLATSNREIGNARQPENG